MNFKKIILYAIAAALGVALWNDWTKEHPTTTAPTEQTSSNASPSANPAAPATFNPAQAAQQAQTETTPTVATPKAASFPVVQIKTDLLDLTVNANTADIVDSKLLNYKVSSEDPSPIQLLSSDQNAFYATQSGITNVSGKINYQTEKNNYVLSPDQKTLSVTFTGKTDNGLIIQKTYVFTRGSYAIQLNTKIQNAGNKAWQGSTYNQIKKLSAASQAFGSRGYEGAAISSAETPYEKITYKYLLANNLDRNISGGWIALQEHYFLTAWIPNQQETNHYYSATENAPYGDEAFYTVGFVSPAMSLAPNQSATENATLYVGPELAEQLKPLAKGLDLTIDYGFLSPISQIIFWVLSELEHFIGNWGWSIVIVTVMIKLLFFQLSEKSFKSMARMREMAPRLQALKERFGDDRQALSQATMEIYRKEKISPLGGCLPMIIQIPVFFALYYVLLESVQLRQADFIFWIHDLSTKDPYYVLPILMGISMFIQQKLTPAPVDSQQAKLMMFLPVIFTIFFATFPAGLVLYWLVNNCVQVLHQWWALKRFERAKTLHKMTHK